MNKKILITGAGGFIGYHLCKNLAQQGHTVIGVDVHYPNENSHVFGDHFHPVVCDFRNWDLMKELLDAAEVVFHLASAHLQISLPESEYWNINVHSMRPFLELAQQRGVQRFVHVSSVGVYGDLQICPANEETPCKPQSIYGETKLAGEAEVHKFSQETGFPVVILRPAWVYGPGCPRTLKIYKALRKGHFIMIGDGNNLRHPLYISDMVSSFTLAMESESALGELFLIGGTRAITTRELVDAFHHVLGTPRPRVQIPLSLGKAIAYSAEFLFSLAGKEPPISKRSLEFFHTNNAFDISKAEKTLHFKPKFSFENGLQDCYEWLTQNS